MADSILDEDDSLEADFERRRKKEVFLIEDQVPLRAAKSHIVTSPEDDIYNKQNELIFQKHFDESDIDVEFILNNGKNAVIAIQQFNVFLREMRILYHMEIKEMLLFLDDMGFKVERTSKLLSSENLERIQKEMINKCRVKTKPSTTDDFLY